jgi:polyhydroxyalkanoate synthesis regulator phasin
MAEGTPRIPTPQDLLGPWRQMAEQAEQQWNQFFNQAMGTEAFASMMGRYMEGYLAFQQSLARNVERYMQSLNLPTRTDITAIGERLASMEAQLSALAAEQRRLLKKVEALENGSGKRAGGKASGNGSA